MPYVLAFDQGTTSSRAIVFDKHGAIRGLDQREYPQHFPEPGWVEHDPNDIWHSQLETAKGALKNAGVAAGDIAAIGITNQRETTMLWDRKTGVPVRNAIVWQDRRTAPLCEVLKAQGYEEQVRRVTGLLLDPYFSGTKIAWMLDNVRGLRERAEQGDIAFGNVDAWLVYNLTAGASHVTDYTNASRTLLFDLKTLNWSDEMLAMLRIPRAVLPQPLPSIGNFGTASASVLGAAIPIAGIAGDQQAALAGQAGFSKGLAKNTYGTGSFMLLNTGNDIVYSKNGMLTTVAYGSAKGKASYALEGSIFVTGAAVQWLRDGLGFITASADVEQLAAQVEDNGGVYFVPAFVGLGAPHWDPYARGAILGLTRGSTRAHIARAALEAVAYQTADVLQAMENDAGAKLAELRVDGGAANNNFTMQFQADILGVDVVRPRVTETTALGAAYLAGISVGLWKDEAEVAKQWEEQRRFKPQMSERERKRLLYRWHRAVERAANWEEPEACLERNSSINLTAPSIA
jgi:glycerol kinase